MRVDELAVARLKRVRQEPYAAFFAPYVVRLAREHRLTQTDWKLLGYAIGQLEYGQRFARSVRYADLAETLAVSRGTLARSLQKLVAIGALYKEHHGGYYPDFYLSSYIAYRGKMSILKRFRQIEDAVHKGATYPDGEHIDLEYQHAAMGGVPDISWPQWLLDHCMMPSEADWMEDPDARPAL